MGEGRGVNVAGREEEAETVAKKTMTADSQDCSGGGDEILSSKRQ